MLQILINTSKQLEQTLYVVIILIPLKVQIISFIGVMQTIARKNTLLETKLLFRLILGKVIKPLLLV
ncbi:hypothetical protein AA650_04015 [Anabaena sp. WA102]|nr:hypothetical protein AA650_04015 [Anabaena sp. WA102]OBQ18630.1 MAG: hypothetical protein AN486_11625 [Anabaena sp. AL93]